MGEKYRCCVCGRENSRKRISKDYYCEKHYSEYMKYGFCISDNDRSPDDPNEIIEHDKYAEIILYDEFQEDTGKRALIDIEDVDRVKNIHWNKKTKCIVGNIKGREIPLQNFILDTNDKVDFVSEDFFDCRRINLYLKKNTKRKRNKTLVSKKNKGKVIIEFVGRSKSQVTSSAIMVSYPVANDKYERILVEFGQSQTNKSL